MPVLDWKFKIFFLYWLWNKTKKQNHARKKKEPGVISVFIIVVVCV